jgi:hypothetical protein
MSDNPNDTLRGHDPPWASALLAFLLAIIIGVVLALSIGHMQNRANNTNVVTANNVPLPKMQPPPNSPANQIYLPNTPIDPIRTPTPALPKP